MTYSRLSLTLALLFAAFISGPVWGNPLGNPGEGAVYRLETTEPIPASVVSRFEWVLGEVEGDAQWVRLRADKAGGGLFNVWLLLASAPPPDAPSALGVVRRYLLGIGDAEEVEYRDDLRNRPVLPTTGAWPYLLPRSPGGENGIQFGERLTLLGLSYVRVEEPLTVTAAPPQSFRVSHLTPEYWIGLPNRSRQVDETRRFDETEYEYKPLVREDYEAMIEAGFTCFSVAKEHADWIRDRDVFYWGVGGADIAYPEALYRSNYIGPSLFFDEPAVHTRDLYMRPKLKEDPAFRKSISPAVVFEAFKEVFHKALAGTPKGLCGGLAAREDVALGEMVFDQANLYTWETMTMTAAYQLTAQRNGPPDAMVFEPPGRLGTRRTLPEWNMAYGCRLPVDRPNAFIDVMYGCLRGAARETGKAWGTSIYGAVDRQDATFWLTHAYNLGATRFFYWDSAMLACVPWSESLALTRHLRNHIANHPDRNLEALKKSGEVALLFPPGYNLGHVHMGRGILWGLGELNLERKTSAGTTHRTVMGNLFTEIERCHRLGVRFDLLWDLADLKLPGYREVVRIREDGKVEVSRPDGSTLLDGPRVPERPEGIDPTLQVSCGIASGTAPLVVQATAEVVDGSAPTFYTVGANPQGVHENNRVLWEIYGPEEEDYYFPFSEIRAAQHTTTEAGHRVRIEFTLDRPGNYRLRSAVCDVAGRTCVVWSDLKIP